MIKKQFGKRFRAICELRGMDRIAAAAFFKVSPSMIDKWQYGINMPQAEYLVEMSRMLGVKLGVLVGEEPLDFAAPKQDDTTTPT